MFGYEKVKSMKKKMGPGAKIHLSPAGKGAAAGAAVGTAAAVYGLKKIRDKKESLNKEAFMHRVPGSAAHKMHKAVQEDAAKKIVKPKQIKVPKVLKNNKALAAGAVAGAAAGYGLAKMRSKKDEQK